MSGTDMSISKGESAFLNASLQDLMMIEMTSLCHRLARNQFTSNPAATADQAETITQSTEEEEMSEVELLESKLESIGYRVGHGLVQRMSRDRPVLHDHLDIIKFICKDLWSFLFQKQIDNLKTNHRGVYVLSDNNFKWFSRMSWNPKYKGGKEYAPYLWYPCGIIRGALQELGMESVVIAECPNGPPAITFQIKTIAKSE